LKVTSSWNVVCGSRVGGQEQIKREISWEKALGIEEKSKKGAITQEGNRETSCRARG